MTGTARTAGGRRGPLERIAFSLFRATGGFLKARTFHPRGAAVAARYEPPPDGSPLAAPLVQGGARPAIVRFSRAFRLPEALPDVLGIAIKVYPPGGGEQDFMLAAFDPGVALARLLGLRRGFLVRPYRGLLPFEARDRSGRRVVLRLRAVPEPPGRRGPAHLPVLVSLRDALAGTPPRVRLEVAVRRRLGWGRWLPLGAVVLGPELGAAEVEPLCYDVGNDAGGISGRGPIQRLRRVAYAGSQAGRDGEPSLRPGPAEIREGLRPRNLPAETR